MELLKITIPGGIVLQDAKGEHKNKNPGYTTTIETVIKHDRKKLLKVTRILFYLIDLVYLPAIFIFGGFI